MKYLISTCFFLILLYNFTSSSELFKPTWRKKVEYARTFIDQGIDKCNQSVKVKEKHCLNAVKKMCLSYNVFDKVTITTQLPLIETTQMPEYYSYSSQAMNGWKDKVSYARKIIEQYYKNCFNSVKISSNHCQNALKKTCIDRQLLTETGEEI
jgi:hypothetical protein